MDDPLVGSLALSSITGIVAVAPGTVHERLLTQGDQLAGLGDVGRGRRGREGGRERGREGGR